jgi:hypothetical protein
VKKTEIKEGQVIRVFAMAWDWKREVDPGCGAGCPINNLLFVPIGILF